MKVNFTNVHFYIELEETQLPSYFAMITAYDPLGKIVSDDENGIANQALEKDLAQLPVPGFRVAFGFDDISSHIPGFASTARLHTLYELAQSYNQFALYLVDGDELSMVTCKEESEVILIPGGFRSRLLPLGKEFY